MGGSHRHVPAPVAGTRLGEDEGVRAVVRAAAGLALTAAVEFVFAVVSGSVALLADGFHNLGDVFTTGTLLVAFAVARRGADRRYTFGLARAEDVAGVLVVLAIAVSAGIALIESLAKLTGEAGVLRSPGWALAAALVGMLGNETVAQYKVRVGRRINSVPLQADGRHSRVDGLASLAAAAGIAGSWAGWPAADPVAGLLLSAVIVWVLVGAVRDVLARLLDRVDPDVPLGEAHALGERVRHRIFHSQPGVAEVDVHLDPAGTDEHASHAETLHQQVTAAHPDHDDHDRDHEGAEGLEPARRLRAPAARGGGGEGADRAGGQAGAPPGHAGRPE